METKWWLLVPVSLPVALIVELVGGEIAYEVAGGVWMLCSGGTAPSASWYELARFGVRVVAVSIALLPILVAALDPAETKRRPRTF